MIVSQIKDIIIESDSHAVMGKALTLVLSRLSVGRRVVSLRWVVFTPIAVPTALVLVRIGVLISPLLTSTTSLVTLVTSWPFGQVILTIFFSSEKGANVSILPSSISSTESATPLGHKGSVT